MGNDGTVIDAVLVVAVVRRNIYICDGWSGAPWLIVRGGVDGCELLADTE